MVPFPKSLLCHSILKDPLSKLHLSHYTMKGFVKGYGFTIGLSQVLSKASVKPHPCRSILIDPFAKTHLCYAFPQIWLSKNLAHLWQSQPCGIVLMWNIWGKLVLNLFQLSLELQIFSVDKTVAEQQRVRTELERTGLKHCNTSFWFCLSSVLMSVFFFLSRTNSWGKCVHWHTAIPSGPFIARLNQKYLEIELKISWDWMEKVVDKKCENEWICKKLCCYLIFCDNGCPRRKKKNT